MKLLFSICAFLISGNALLAQPIYDSAISFGQTYSDHVQTIRVDDQGNIYAFCYLAGSAASPVIINNDSIESSSFVILKMDNNYNIIWKKEMPGLAHSLSKGIDVDDEGNVYASGLYSSVTYYDGFVLPDYGYASYLLKLDENGICQWVKTMKPLLSSSTDYARSRAIECDGNGNILVIGDFNSDFIGFENDTIANTGNQTLIPPSNNFIVKYDGSGNVLWADNIGIMNSSVCEIELAVDSDNSVLITTGMENDTLVFGSSTLTDPGNPNVQMVLFKYDEQGNQLWATSSVAQPGTNHGAYGITLTSDLQNNVYVGGTYHGQLDIFPNQNQGTDDVFIVKFDENGNFLWSNTAKTPGDDHCTSIAVDSYQQLYVTGFFTGSTITFDGISYPSANQNAPDIFLAKYDHLGNFSWVDIIGGYNGEQPQSLTVDNQNNVFLAGYFQSDTLTYGGGYFVNNAAGYRDAFILKIQASSAASITPVNSSAFKVYPNPFTTNLNIELEEPIDHGTVIVRNMLGEVVFSDQIENNASLSVSRGELPAGMYTVELMDHSELYLKTRVIISD